MEITLVTHNLVQGDGQGEVNRRLAGYLALSGHTVHLVAHRVHPDLARMPNIIVHRIALPFLRPALMTDLIFMTLSSLMIQRAELLDTILHLNGAVSLVRHRVNSCHFCHSAFSEVIRHFRLGLSPYHVFYHRLHAGLERRVFRRCSEQVVAVSRKIKDELGEVVRPGQKVKVIYNGVDNNTVSRQAARERLEREFNFDRDTVVLLFAGELRRKRKGLGTVLDALELLRDEPNVVLLVAGRQQGSSYVAEAARKGLNGRVIFCGFRNDLRMLLAAADVFVLPVFYDPFPGVLLEALAAGTPVVVSSPHYCGSAELVEDGKSGVLVQDPANVEELREKLLFLIRNGKLRREIGEAGKGAILPFSWERMCAEYEEIYREMSFGGGQLQ